MQALNEMPLIIVLSPLVASLVTGLGCRLVSRTFAHMLTILGVGVSFFLSCWILKALVFEGNPGWEQTLYTWGVSGNVSFQLGFLIDRLTALMMVVVTFVSWMVHIYTVGYMRDDPGYQRFFSYISLFTFGMLMLVMSNNFLQLFFGWEMVGLMSYLLIGFWFQRESAIFASLKAFLVNRIGDLGFLIGIAAIVYYFDSLNYHIVFQHVHELVSRNAAIVIWDPFAWSVVTVICIALFIGAMGKSAQVPLHVWLPDSMEGPTPISALIHAATMVTAGVFMVARMSPLFECSEVALNFVLVIGAITCLTMGLLGIVQNDIKRIIAYSTLSQLGYMVTALGASAYEVAIFHLMTHAFFKALLFLGAGSIIIALHHEQNIWKMGDLKKYMPITYVTMLIGSLALIGFPLFSGFYSKDLIIEMVHASRLPASKLAYGVVLGSVFVTALYTFRLFFVVFHGQARMDKHTRDHLQRSPAVIWIPLVLLAIPSIISGGMFIQPLLQGFFGDSLVVQAHPTFPGVFEMALQGLVGLPFWLGIAGILTAWICYHQYPMIPIWLQKKFIFLYTIFKNKYGFDALNEGILVPGTRSLGWFCWRLGDRLIIDDCGVNGSAKGIGKLSTWIRRVQTGYLYHYAFAMITGFLALLVWLMLN